MGIKERRERERENLRQAILDAAGELFVKEGFENVSVRKIAKKIEYSATTIYIYFKDKSEIFDCLLEDYFTKFDQALAAVYDEHDDPITMMKRGMKVYIECGLKNPNYYRLAFMGNLEISKENYLRDGIPGTKTFFGHRTAVEECIRQGLFRQLDVDLVTQVLWSMNHGITSLLISNPNFPWVDREQLINQSIESTLAGFLK